MIQSSLFFEPEESSQSLRDSGIAHVIDHNRAFIERMRTVARRICEQRGTVSTDRKNSAPREWARDNGIEPPHFKAWSGILRGREFEFVEWTESRWPSNHSRRIAAYGKAL